MSVIWLPIRSPYGLNLMCIIAYLVLQDWRNKTEVSGCRGILSLWPLTRLRLNR